jgi:Uncharacterized protein conserved in bacteria (DUF2188)
VPKMRKIWTRPGEHGGWVNIVEGNTRPSSRHETKAEAVAAGRERAKKLRTEHVITTKDGKIQQRNSYGHDPRSRKG